MLCGVEPDEVTYLPFMNGDPLVLQGEIPACPREALRPTANGKPVLHREDALDLEQHPQAEGERGPGHASVQSRSSICSLGLLMRRHCVE